MSPPEPGLPDLYVIVRPKAHWIALAGFGVVGFGGLFVLWFVARALLGTVGSVAFLVVSWLAMFGFGKMMQRWQAKVVDGLNRADEALRSGALEDAALHYDASCGRTRIRPDIHSIAVLGRGITAIQAGDHALGERLLREALDAGWLHRRPEALRRAQDQLDALRSIAPRRD